MDAAVRAVCLLGLAVILVGATVWPIETISRLGVEVAAVGLLLGTLGS